MCIIGIDSISDRIDISQKEPHISNTFNCLTKVQRVFNGDRLNVPTNDATLRGPQAYINK